MASTISNLNLVNGQEIPIPYEVTGTCTGDDPGGGPVVLIAAARQIDDQPTIDLGSECNPSVPDTPTTPTTTNFAFTLTENDCPVPGAFFLLTLLFWDSGAAPALTQTSVSFKTLGLPHKGP